MEYRSPLGYNFKLDQSLSALREEKNKESPKTDDFRNSASGRQKKSFSDFDNRRNSGGNRNYSPSWQRHSNSWKSPRNSQHDGPPPVEQFFHPSMLENPWEELEKNLNASIKS